MLAPAALTLWLGGALADKAIKTFSPDAQTTVAKRQLPHSLVLKGQTNSTPGYRFESQDRSWHQLVEARALLQMYSPSTGDWFDDMHRDGKLVFVDNDTFFGYSRHSDFRRWNGQLTLYPAFFNVSDARKIATIEHEHSHSLETIPGYISNSIAPQVVIGSILKSYGTTEGSRELGKNWSYFGNASETAAIKRERIAAEELGDPETIRYDWQTDQVTTWPNGARSIDTHRKWNSIHQ